MVRLEVLAGAKVRHQQESFNSYMVRLEVNYQSILNVMHDLFQFLYGAIGRVSLAVWARMKHKFQFLYGAIGRRGEETGGVDCVVSIPIWCDWKRMGYTYQKNVVEFQFLYGAIGSVLHTSPPSPPPRFNSYMVRLEAVLVECHHFSRFVSIPIWCDWKMVLEEQTTFWVLFQFLYGAIGSRIGSPGFWCPFLFQFLYGAIGRWSWRSKQPFGYCFNSYMVRLEVG